MLVSPSPSYFMQLLPLLQPRAAKSDAMALLLAASGCAGRQCITSKEKKKKRVHKLTVDETIER
jgi:hypothetical protein